MSYDLRYTVRLLRRAPAFALAAVATLSLGIGASTAMFTIVDTVVLRPLRFPEPERLVMLRPTSGARVSAGYFDEWRRQSRTFADMAAWYDARVTMTGHRCADGGDAAPGARGDARRVCARTPRDASRSHRRARTRV